MKNLFNLEDWQEKILKQIEEAYLQNGKRLAINWGQSRGKSTLQRILMAVDVTPQVTQIIIDDPLKPERE